MAHKITFKKSDNSTNVAQREIFGQAAEGSNPAIPSLKPELAQYAVAEFDVLSAVTNNANNKSDADTYKDFEARLGAATTDDQKKAIELAIAVYQRSTEIGKIQDAETDATKTLEMKGLTATTVDGYVSKAAAAAKKEYGQATTTTVTDSTTVTKTDSTTVTDTGTITPTTDTANLNQLLDSAARKKQADSIANAQPLDSAANAQRIIDSTRVADSTANAQKPPATGPAEWPSSLNFSKDEKASTVALEEMFGAKTTTGTGKNDIIMRSGYYGLGTMGRTAEETRAVVSKILTDAPVGEPATRIALYNAYLNAMPLSVAKADLGLAIVCNQRWDEVAAAQSNDNGIGLLGLPITLPAITPDNVGEYTSKAFADAKAAYETSIATPAPVVDSAQAARDSALAKMTPVQRDSVRIGDSTKTAQDSLLNIKIAAQQDSTRIADSTTTALDSLNKLIKPPQDTASHDTTTVKPPIIVPPADTSAHDTTAAKPVVKPPHKTEHKHKGHKVVTTPSTDTASHDTTGVKPPVIVPPADTSVHDTTAVKPVVKPPHKTEHKHKGHKVVTTPSTDTSSHDTTGVKPPVIVPPADTSVHDTTGVKPPVIVPPADTSGHDSTQVKPPVKHHHKDKAAAPATGTSTSTPSTDTTTTETGTGAQETKPHHRKYDGPKDGTREFPVAADGSVSYTIQKDDTLYRIARDNKPLLAQIKAACDDVYGKDKISEHDQILLGALFIANNNGVKNADLIYYPSGKPLIMPTEAQVKIGTVSAKAGILADNKIVYKADPSEVRGQDVGDLVSLVQGVVPKGPQNMTK